MMSALRFRLTEDAAPPWCALAFVDAARGWPCGWFWFWFETEEARLVPVTGALVVD